jgi:hypothetical protein
MKKKRVENPDLEGHYELQATRRDLKEAAFRHKPKFKKIFFRGGRASEFDNYSRHFCRNVG